MPVMSIVTALLAGITLSVGILHLIGWLRGWASRRHLTFALTCFAIVLYDFGCSGLYAADSPGEGALWQRTESLALLLAMMAFIWFLHDHARWSTRVPAVALTGLVGLLLVGWLRGFGNQFWGDEPVTRTVGSWLPGSEIVYQEMRAGPLMTALVTVAAAVLVFALASAIRLRRQGRYDESHLLIATSIVFAAAATHDYSIAMGWLHSIYLLEYVLVILLVLLTIPLARDTGRVRDMELALQAARLAYREVLDAADEGICFLDIESGRVLDVNESTLRICEMTREEALGASPAIFQGGDPPYSEVEAERWVHQAAEEGPQLFTWRGQRRNGDAFWTEITLRRAEISGGSRLIMVMREVTERKSADDALRHRERELAEANNMLRLVLDTIPVRVFWKDRNLRYLGCNRLFAQDSGHHFPEELLGDDDYAMTWHNEADLYRADDTAVITSEIPRINYEEPQTTPDGSQIWLRTSKLPLRDADGRVIGVLGTYEDITEGKRSEERLRSSERNLDITLNSIGDAVIATDADGRVTRINPVAERLTGWSAEEAWGQDLTQVFRVVNAQNGGGTADPVELALKHDEVVSLERDVVLISRAGKRYRIAESAAPIRSPDGVVLGVVLVFRDVTEELAIQEQLRHAQKMDAIGRLAGGVAHDFNNLLQAIEGYTELSLADLPADHTVRPYLAEVRTAVARAAALTRQLLAFSRRDALQPQPLDLNHLIGNLSRALRRVLGKHVELEVRTAAVLDTILADPGQMEQILLNLCINARDAMPDGGRLTIATANVHIGARESRDLAGLPEKDYVCMTVTDTGQGIPPEIRDRVFDPFFTTKEVGEGTGLGLATVYAIAERHGGAVILTSDVGLGTRFDVYLPVTDAVAITGEPAVPVLPQIGGDETILLAEDDPLVRKLAVKILENAGYHLIIARDGEEAIRLFDRSSSQIALAILDVVMPRKSGREVYETITAARPELPVLFSSGYSYTAFERERLPNEDVVLVQKPYSPQRLLQLVRELLDKGKSVRE